MSGGIRNNMNRIKRIRTIDLFAGCGGLSLGLTHAGFEVVAAFDNWDAAIRVYTQNFIDHPIINMDLSLPTILDRLDEIQKYKPHMIAGGPPCQDYSHAGKRNEELGRADLTLAFAEVVSAVRPQLFLMENVDRIVSSKRLPIARKRLRKAGYGIAEVVLDASLCGVPQRRKRYFMFGVLGREDCVDFVDICQRRIANEPMTIRQALGGLLGVEHYYRHPRNYSRRGVFSVDEPSPTIRGVNRPVPAGYPGHPADSAPVTKKLRPLTTIERSYIQTFPKYFRFTGSKSDLEQMIGNSIPVKLAEFVGRAISEYLNSLREKEAPMKARARASASCGSQPSQRT